MTTAPIADTAPIKAVAIITLPVIPFRPMTNSCSSSSSAGSEKIAMKVSTSLRWKKNILSLSVVLKFICLFLGLTFNLSYSYNLHPTPDKSQANLTILANYFCDLHHRTGVRTCRALWITCV